MNYRALAWAVAGSVLSLILLAPSPLPAQCILLPDSPGQNGQTRLQNFYTLVNDLYSRDSAYAPTHRVLISGKYLQAPPWFNSSTECAVANLKNGSGAINPPLASPSFSNYLVVSDELSELAVLTSLADDDNRMLEIHNTIQALIGGMQATPYFGLPCWIAEVKVTEGSITCRRLDTATDATARFGLAYYHAANNPKFLGTSQQIYRAAGDALAARHLEVEYAFGEHISSVTGANLKEWIGGGAETSSFGVGGLEMWIGYHQDVARFLLAAYESTGDPRYADRAREVVDQWLIASTFNGFDLTFGRKNFAWNTSIPLIAPQPGKSPDNLWWWDQGRAWDDSDAPRGLWMGDVLRAVNLSTGGTPLSGAYSKLSQWVQLVHSNGTQTATTSCIQYNQNGTAINCGTDYYFNGLGAGLHTYHNTSTLDDKLDRALTQYRWTGSKTWNGTPCFGIYRGIRPVKALASAIGLDSTTYGGTSCTGPLPLSQTLTVSKTGTGSGTLTSSPAGINCGVDCSESYVAGTSVALTANPATGSTFTGWSGACSGTGSCQITMDSAQSVSANFSGCGTSVPIAPSWLRVDPVSQTELKLTWQDNSNNESGFKVERKEGCCGPWTLLSNAPANATGTAIYQSTGLKCGTTYAYRVWGFNCAGETAKTNEAAKATNACN